MKIIIDQNAGVCTGVKKAIRIAEEYLQKDRPLYALGSLIHNQREVERLKARGLETLSQEEIEKDEHPAELKGKPVLIRAHGISDALRQKLQAAGAELLDGTCVIVRRIQKKVEEYYQAGHQILIVGKKGHPEVVGLLGYCNNEGIVLQDENDLQRIEPDRKTVLFSQTTVSPEKFAWFRDAVQSIVKELIVMDTICRQISNRHDRIRDFARSVDVVLFVGGKKSSNTAVLHSVSLQVNPRSYRIESSEDIDPNWLKPDDVVGLTGGASTPIWQLQQIRDDLEKMPVRAKNKSEKEEQLNHERNNQPQTARRAS